MNTLSLRLVWARTQKKLSQEELAKLSGVSQGSIGHLESGLRQSSRRITAIANALGVNPQWLAEGKGDPHGDVTQNDQVAYPPEIQDVIDLMLKTDERGRLKMKLAAIDAFELHNSHISRTQSIALDDEELRMIEKRRRASKVGKDLIDTATETAHEDEQFTQSANRA